MIPANRRNAARLFPVVVLGALMLVGTSTLAGAAPSKASAAKISAHLTKKSFTKAQVKKVKVIYKFSARSKSFSYLLSLKKGSKWQKVKSVKKKGHFKGSKSMTIKKVFAGKPVKIGRYRLKLSADGGSKTLSFKVVKAKTPVPPPTGSKPANTALPTISGTAKQGQNLTASRGSWSHSPTSYDYRWDRCVASGAICTDIGGATSSSYTLVAGDIGSTIRVVVTASNDYGSASATSGKTAVVSGLPPANTALPTISGTTTQGQTLSASNGSWSNSATSHAYKWRRCDNSGASCSDISGAVSSSYTLVLADVAHTIRVVVTASNAYGSASATSDQTVVVSGLPPANTALPTISGTTTQGNKLTAENGSWSNSPTSYAYQWRRCGSSGTNCANISGATSSTYTLVSSDVGSTMRVIVAAFNSYGSTNATSSQTAVVKPPPTVTTVDAGASHTCAFASSGTVKCWGHNDFGQLGNGTDNDSPTPVQVNGITTATAISDGGSHTCALLSGGAIRCWGSNDNGELGNGTSNGSSTPVQVSGITTATQISAGGSHTCALLSDHTVRCWGYNYYGQLGNGADGYDGSSQAPVVVSGITTATAISAGDSHTCAMLSGGAVKCWGYNYYGQLGNGAFGDGSSSPIPVQVSGVTTATQISAGGSHTCAMLSGGTVKCWGNNGSGQLGNNSTTNSSTPVQVSGITTAKSISDGDSHTCALLSTGTIKCWGDNEYGQLGGGTDGYGGMSLTPVQVGGITTAWGVSAGGSHTCAVLSDHTVRCWGYSDYGQLGNGEMSYHSSTPVQVNGVTTATRINAGGYHTCALSGGTVKCWGRNTYGQLGDGTSDSSPIPVQVSGIAIATAISTGANHTCALSGGTVKCWGYNYYGQLGDGTSDSSPIPVQISGITIATAISTGANHSCALLSDGKVMCWGDNEYGQLGNGTDGYGNSSLTPVQVSGITTATAISAGDSHTCALLSNHTVKCWGYNYYGQLGNGAFGDGSSSPIPVQVSGITTATTISAGGSHTCAMLSGGAVKCWGYNYYGQLGNNSWTNSSTPVQVSGITTAAAISTGDSHTCALLTGGTVKCWGYNYYGQLGNGMYGYDSDSLIPVQISGITTATAISAGSSHSCAVLSSGAVKCWGYSEYGQLGDGAYDSHSMIPVNVVGLP
jgi:alpha-tubulin suppressor-like RCC1 family protein